MNQPTAASHSRLAKTGITVVVLLVTAGIATLGYAWWPTGTRDIDAQLPAQNTPEMARLIDAGRYVAVAADCIACHTGPSGTPFAGGLPMGSPIGTLYSTNITPDPRTGIGGYSLRDFDRAVRHGIAPDGTTLYPAMPYPSYAKLTDEDTRALYAYFLHGVTPVEQANQTHGVSWPMSMRWPLALWRKTFAPYDATPPTGPDTARYGDISVARGAYLAQAAGHCGSCHTPRASTMQERALDDSSPLYLSGGQVIDGWFAGSLRGNNADGLGRWSAQDIVDSLKTARNAHAAMVGPMSYVVTNSTQHMADEDLRAIAAYLKTLPGPASEPSGFVADATTAAQLRSGVEVSRGAEIYVDNCAACHRTDGKGYKDAFPAIAGNPTVLARDATSLIRLILGGSALPSTQTRPSNLGMPGFHERLSDQEVVQLVDFVRQSWGNQASPATAAQVATARQHLDAERQQQAANR